jgi:hypothetical protein
MDKRRFPRVPCLGGSEIYWAAGSRPCAARIIELSLEGCLLSLVEPDTISCGTTLEVAFSVNHVPFRVRGEVRSVQSDRRVGIYFDRLSERVKGHLDDLLLELRQDIFKRQVQRQSAARKAQYSGDD